MARASSSAASPFLASDPHERHQDAQLLKGLLRRAEQAKDAPIPFFNFVMREERTLRRLEAAAHQRLLFEFVTFYDHCVVRMPIGSSKTFCMAALTLWLLGRDPTERGAIISATQGQAAKPFSMVQDYLNEPAFYPELRLTFPALRRSHRRKDPWTQTKLVVDRPPGIRDPSLVAIGIDGKLPGSRLSWLLLDDILTEENTRTAEQRSKVSAWLLNTVLSRKDVVNSKIVVCNTPWHPDDVTYRLERAGWPTLTMGIDGTITLTNADDFDSEEIRPASSGAKGKSFRLAAHDRETVTPETRRTVKKAGEQVQEVLPPVGAQLVAVIGDGRGQPLADPMGRYKRLPCDAKNDNAIPWGKGPPLEVLWREHYDLDETVPLWPAKFHPRDLETLRALFRNTYSQLYLCVCRDDETAQCKEAWIEACKANGRAAGFRFLEQRYAGSNLTVTGVDLAIGQGEEHDSTALFTFEVIPSITLHFAEGPKTLKNCRRILDVEIGKFRGRAVVDKVIDKVRRFGSIVRVETNGGQEFLRQWTLDVDISVPIRAHVTTSAKGHRITGVAGLFIELENGAWLIPCDELGVVPAAVQVWIDECLNYRPPPAHTGDGLMASYLARAQARELDFGEDEGGSVAAAIGAR